jgi:uncharacterized protein YebE (UPF0316 family)
MFLGASLIFSLRILDVTVGTVKLLYIVNGRRTIAACLAFIESAIWLTAAGLVFSQITNLANGLAFTLGFASGTAVGMTIERWIGAGHVLIRIVSRDESIEWMSALRDAGFGLTSVQGQGSEGIVQVVLLVTRRRRAGEAMKLIQEIEPDAFVTIDPISHASGGYLIPPAAPSALRK